MNFSSARYIRSIWMARKPDIHVDLHDGHTRWFECKLNLHVPMFACFVFLLSIFFILSFSLSVYFCQCKLQQSTNSRFIIMHICIRKVYESKVQRYLTLHVCNRLKIAWSFGSLANSIGICVCWQFSLNKYSQFFDIIYLDFRVFAVFCPLSAFADHEISKGYVNVRDVDIFYTEIKWTEFVNLCVNFS